MSRSFSTLFNLLSAALFMLTGYVILFGQRDDWSTTGRGGVAFIAAVACALIGNVDKFETLKASLSGVEAKTREVAHVVEEARVTLEQFNVLAEMLGSLLIEQLAASGRFGGGGTAAQKDQQRKRIMDTLNRIGLSSDVLDRVDSSDKFWVTVDYSLGIQNWVRSSEACSAECKQIVEDIQKRWGQESVLPTPDEFKAMIRTGQCKDEDVVELIEDYDYYLKKGEHRRPTVWSNRANWLR